MKLNSFYSKVMNVFNRLSKLFRSLLHIFTLVFDMFAALSTMLADDLHNVFIVLFVVRHNVIAAVAVGAIPCGKLSFPFSHSTNK